MSIANPAAEVVDYACACCRQSFSVSADSSGRHTCSSCGSQFEYAPRYLKYDYDTILFRAFKNRYLLNKVLNNNGYLSYQWLQSGSLSLPDREDVARFREFIRGLVPKGRILDIGCGILPRPGYLDFAQADAYSFVGLDPIDDSSFDGLRIVGASEFIPFPEASFDAVVFATSLDHVCALEQSLEEAQRVLRPGGAILVWMSNRKVSWWAGLRRKLSTLKQRYQKGYRVDRYGIFPNGVVLAIPPGAVDPFHSYFESPKALERQLRHAGFSISRLVEHNPDLVFICGRRA